MKQTDPIYQAHFDAVRLATSPTLRPDDVAKILGLSISTVVKMNLPWAPVSPGSRVLFITREAFNVHLDRQARTVESAEFDLGPKPVKRRA